MSAALHVAVLALLLLLALFQNVPQPRFAAIDVTYVQIGEGEGSEAPRPGVHAAQPEATPGAAPQAPELTAPPGTEEKPAAAGAPPPGDCGRGRKFLREVCLSAHRLPEEGGK